MLWIIVALSLVLWLICGHFGIKLAQLTTANGGAIRSSGAMIFKVFGPIMLLVGAGWAYDAKIGLLMTRKDKRNPFHTELSEALHQYRLLQWVPGKEARIEREELREDINELRSWPTKLKGHDGDRLIAAMKTELEQSHELRRARLEAFQKIEMQITEGVYDELNP